MFKKKLSAGFRCGWLVVAGAVSAASCGSDSPQGFSDTAGRVQVALMGVPADGTCVRVEAVGYRTARQNFLATAGSSHVFEMKGLPLGQVTFTAAAFGGGCPSAGSAAVPNWVSDAPFTTTVVVSPPSLVTLNLVRNGSAIVAVGFNDQLDGSAQPDAGAAQADASTGMPPTGEPPKTPSFMLVPGVTGESQAPGFEGWFSLEDFTLSATRAVAAGGGGGAVGKAQWAASATLRFQKGSPALYSFAVTGRVAGNLTFVVQSAGDSPFVWRAKLQNARVAAIKPMQVPDVSGAAVPLELVNFVFDRIDLEFDPGNAPGAPLVTAFWDLARNTGSAAPRPPVPLQFVIGGSAEPPFKSINAFRAPSEMSSATTGGGGSGKPTFSDASVTLPMDASMLGIFLEFATSLVTPDALVQIKSTVAGQGPGVVVGSYGFKDVAITELTLSGWKSMFGFRAAGFSWTYGTETVTFDPSRI